MSINSFNTEIAKQVGVNAAVIYQNIQFWCEKNRANKKNIHDGKAWTYNSRQAFAELFSYLSEKQIRTALDKLVEVGLLESGNFNKSSYDRTKWYSSTGPDGPIDWPKKANGLDLKGQPIPDSKHRCKTQMVNNSQTADAARRVFDHWLAEMGKCKTRTMLTPNRKAKILKRLQTYSEDRIKLAITGCAKSAFHMGQNKDGKVYDDLELICRNDENIEKFEQMALVVSPQEQSAQDADDWINGNTKTIWDK